jgi:hypothetical protein
MSDETPQRAPSIDWRLTTWDGARREELRRWSQLPLERIIAALEEMADLQSSLSGARDRKPPGAA